MKLHFLGTNGWYDTKLGNTLSVLLDTDKAYVVFDAGGGFYKLDKYIKNNKPIILLLSHFHLDHIIGLHTLNKFRFAQGIDIYGPPGLKTLFKKVINKPYTIPIRQLHFRVRLHEIGHSVLLPEGIHYKSLKHSTVCYGYTVLGEGKKLAFCTDTGLCKNLILLVQDSDLLITECSYRTGQRDDSWPHLNPEMAAGVAKEARVRRLILAHFDSGVYLTNKDRILAQKAARKIFKNTLAAKDGLRLIL